MKFNIHFMIKKKKALIKGGIERAYLNLTKAIYGNPTTDIIQISENV